MNETLSKYGKKETYDGAAEQHGVVGEGVDDVQVELVTLEEKGE
jgi:hypothetical protein